MISFNPRSRKGSDGIDTQTQKEVVTVSIHAPARGATSDTNLFILARAEFQSTLPQGERPHLKSGKSITSIVSIHAPARGATTYYITFYRKISVFQSTLPQGERPRKAPLMISSNRFNPRSRKGSDSLLSFSGSSNISFNPRSRKGSDATAFKP